LKKAELRKNVREATDAELEKMLADTRKELFHFCYQRSTKQLEKAHRIRESRKHIARILQAQAERAKAREAGI
jgi:large subunit ribosomal protein L29